MGVTKAPATKKINLQVISVYNPSGQAYKDILVSTLTQLISTHEFQNTLHPESPTSSIVPTEDQAGYN